MLRARWGAWCQSLSCFNLLTCACVKSILSSIKHRLEPSGRKQLQLFNTNVMISLIAGESFTSHAAPQASDYTVAVRRSEVSLSRDQVIPRVLEPIIKTVWKVSRFVTNQSLCEEMHSEVLFLWLTWRRRVTNHRQRSQVVAVRWQTEWILSFNGRRTLWGCWVLRQTAWHKRHT